MEKAGVIIFFWKYFFPAPCIKTDIVWGWKWLVSTRGSARYMIYPTPYMNVLTECDKKQTNK